MWKSAISAAGSHTPAINRVARKGCTFTDYYRQQSCTAGRGQNPLRTGLTRVGMPGAQAEDPTIAELLKPLGYATGQFGKENLGDWNEYLNTCQPCMASTNSSAAATVSLGIVENPATRNLSGSKRNCDALFCGTGFCPVSGAIRSTCSHMSGEGKLMTQSGHIRNFLSVCVSVSRPSVIVQPSAQKEEMGARLGEPSRFIELTNATGVPKYRILGCMVANSVSS